MGSVRSFRDLVAYERSREVVREVYRFTKEFPKVEQFALTNQIRRAACSIALNIAEGYGIGTSQGTLRHLRIARGSLCEVRAGLDLATDLGFAHPGDHLLGLLEETARVLQGLIKSMEQQRK